ncbi:ead/Ea22-like family protein [Escherichia coli]|uniref:ead/Ea22-like family protein n=1 Tax=Escherichia coli TaxID=562 RepID=UPI003CF2E0AA
MSKIDYQALRDVAVKAGKDKWQAKKINGDFFVIRHGSYTRQHGYTSYQPIAGIDCKPVRDFVAKASPATVLALLDERERNQQYIKSRDQENEDIALTVGRLRVELEGKDSKIANLTDERDALREGEMGDARHSNTRAAADIYFQLVEECEIPAGGSLVEYVDDMREKLEAAEKRIAELELREVVLPQCYSMLHRVDFDEPYHTEMVYRQHQVLEALHNAGINVTEAGKGEAS